MSEDKNDLQHALKQAQNRITELEAQLNGHAAPSLSKAYLHALDNLIEGCEIIGFDWRYLYLNNTAARYGRHSKEEMLGRTLMENYPGIETTPLFALIQKCMIERTAQNAELEFTYPSGDSAWFEFSIQPIPEGVFILTLDITQRKQTEDTLRESQERYRMVVEDQTELICRYDADFTLTFVNPAYSATYGSTPEEMIGKNLLPLIPPEHHELAINHVRNLTPSKPVATTEHKSIVLDGTQRWFEWTDRALFDETGRIIEYQGVGRDITERRQNEEQLEKLYSATSRLYQQVNQHAIDLEHRVIERTAALQSSKDRLEAILNNSPDGILLTNPKLEIQQTNKAFNELFMCDAESCLGKSLLDFIHPQDRELVSVLLQKAVKEHRKSQVEARFKYQDVPLFEAVMHIAYLQGEATEGCVCTIQDITQRKAQQTALEENRLFIKRITETAPNLIYIYDLAEQRNIYINRDVANLMGYSSSDPQEIHDRPFQTLMHPEDMANIPSHIKRVQAAHENQIIEFEYRMLHRSGQWKWFLSRDVGFRRDVDGKVLQLLGTATDITERKQAELAVQKYAEEVQDLYNNAPCGYHSVNADGVIMQINDTELRWLGYQREELVGKRCFSDLIDFEPDQIFHLPMLKQQGWISDVKYRLIRKDGSAMDILLNASAIYDENGQFLKSRATLFDLTKLKQAEDALHAKIEEEHQFQETLKKLYEITIELTQIDDLDTFYRRAVELGIERFGFERLGLLLYDEAELLALGTYGTDKNGNVFAEPHVRLDPSGHSGILKRSLDNPKHFWFDEEAPLYSNYEFIGTGWSAMTTLWNGTEVLGWLGADNAVRHAPVTNMLLEILALYSLAISTLLVQKRTQAALRESESRFRILIETISDIVMRLDTQGQYTYLSPSCKRLLGYEPQELIGQVSFKIIHPDDLPAVQKIAQAAGSTRVPYEPFQARFQHKEGHYVWLETSGQTRFSEETGEALEFVTISRDITERIERERQLRYNASLQQNVTDAVISTDLNFIIQSWNPAAERIYRWSAKEVIGRRLNEVLQTQFLSNESAERVRQDFLEHGSWSDEVIQLRKDGTRINILSSVVLFKDEHGQPFGIVGVNHDITERKKVEEALRQALEKEKELGELKSRFVSMASHEFRTPLATILALNETLTAYRHKMTDEQIDRRLSKIHEQIEHLNDIMEDMLQLSRMQARRAEFNPVRLNLDSLCVSVIDEFQSQPNMIHNLVYNCDDALQEVKLDKKLMRQIIRNLVSNAIKYSPEHETVTIHLKQAEQKVILSVGDQGIGIPESDLQHLFEPFHRASNVGAISGTGLGLVIVKESVELHGGSIAVESELNIGTTFSITIPILA